LRFIRTSLVPVLKNKLEQFQFGFGSLKKQNPDLVPTNLDQNQQLTPSSSPSFQKSWITIQFWFLKSQYLNFGFVPVFKPQPWFWLQKSYLIPIWFSLTRTQTCDSKPPNQVPAQHWSLVTTTLPHSNKQTHILIYRSEWEVAAKWKLDGSQSPYYSRKRWGSCLLKCQQVG